MNTVEQVNRTLQLLVPSVYKLRSDYQTLETCSETADRDNALVFLSRLSLDEYHVAEEHFTQELVGFTKKQFFKVIKLHRLLLLWLPCVADADIIFLPCGFFLSFFFSSPNVSGHRLDVYHTSTHGVALVRI